MAYIEVNMNVPTKSHEKILKGVTNMKPVSIPLDLTGPPDHKLFVTTGQKKKIESAISRNRKGLTIRMSHRQVQYNHKQGGFIGTMLASAARFLPAILTGLIAGESMQEGDGMFLGKSDATYRFRHSGEGLVVTHAPDTGERGFYVKVGDKTYHKGSGLLHGLFGKIPLLNILF